MNDDQYTPGNDDQAQSNLGQQPQGQQQFEASGDQSSLQGGVDTLGQDGDPIGEQSSLKEGDADSSGSALFSGSSDDMGTRQTTSEVSETQSFNQQSEGDAEVGELGDESGGSERQGSETL